MRFLSLAMACLMVSAESNLANQLNSLKSMVKATGEWDTNNMIEVISYRKEELQDALDAKTMSKDEVAGELRYLLQLVRDVESNDKTHAVQTLTTRKANLVNLAADGEETEEDKEDKSMIDKKVEDAQAALEGMVKEDDEEAYTEAEKTLKDKQSSLDAAKLKLKAAKTAQTLDEKAGGHGMLVTGIVALVVIGGGCYCYNKNKAENEGGDKEDKKLFKKVFKGKSQKKAVKDEIIPTFAVPAE